MDSTEKIFLALAAVAGGITIVTFELCREFLWDANKAKQDLDQLSSRYTVDQLLQARRELKNYVKKEVPLVVRSYNRPSWEKGVEPIYHTISGRHNQYD